ncbi:MAG: 3-deoxy-D-manno-octulosonic acid transferase [Terricaulis sp.]
MSFSPALAFYRTATTMLGPFAGAWLNARAKKGKEDPNRIAERFGRYANANRPSGVLVWLHAASVGESGVALHLAEALGASVPGLSFLLTTGTKTSAELVARRGGANVRHVYAPLDRRDIVARFLAHWRPDLGIFVESELWPNLILGAQRAGVKLALVNARMSASSLRRWRNWRNAGSRVMRAFAFANGADQRTADSIAMLRGEQARTIGNLKLAAPAPHIDRALRADLAAQIGERPLWLAASTHEGEDEIVLAAHERLRQLHPRALLIIAPRHPERGGSVAALAGGAPRRSLGDGIGQASVFVADTMGELGALYDLAPVSLVAGSLIRHLKGHNPIEPAKLGSAVLSGPYVDSFEPVFETLRAARGLEMVSDSDSLAACVDRLWRDHAARTGLTEAARQALASGASAWDETLSALRSLLPAPSLASEHAHAPA